MTVMADNKGRIHLEGCMPGEEFELRRSPEGAYILIPISKDLQQHAGVRLGKKDGYTVLISDRPVDLNELQKALDEFP